MDAFLESLNEEQLECVLHEAQVLQILAGPGSGKTRVLTIRIAAALLNRNIRPEAIVVVTFTNKAATELRHRLTDLVGSDLTKRLIIGTFHSVSLRYLQRYGTNIGLDKKFSIADSSESRNVVSKLLKALRKSDSVGNPPFVAGADEQQLSPSSAMSYISQLKSRGAQVEDVENCADLKRFSVHVGPSMRNELVFIFTQYQNHLKLHNLLDFDDLIIHCIELLSEHPRIVSTTEHVFVDEFQDTSSQQFTLMSLLAQARKGLTIVGDHDQSIYGFRAADIQNFRKMHLEYPQCNVIHLKQNYRSTGAIVFAASALIGQDRERPAKELETQNVLGPQPTLRQLRTAKTEADWISKEIQRLIQSTGRLIRFEDVSILVRSASLTLPIEQALQRNRVPYRLTNARKFLERSHIKVIINYLRAIHDETSLGILEIINIPPRRFGQTSLEQLQHESVRIKRNLWQTLQLVSKGSILLSKRRDCQMESRLSILVNLIQDARTLVSMDKELKMAHLIDFLLQKLQFDNYLKQQYPEDYADRQVDVQEFIQTADLLADSTDMIELPEIPSLKSNDLGQGNILDRLLSSLALMSDTGPGADTEAKACVTISTIHSAKGLEWPIVFIPGVYHGSIPSARVEEQEQDEERRLLYVAMTRARALLYMSYPLKSARFEAVKLSSFLADNSMIHFLQERGADITLHTIKELATVLQRAYPEAKDVLFTKDVYEDRTEERLADLEYDLSSSDRTRKQQEIPAGVNGGFSTAAKVLNSLPAESVNIIHESKISSSKSVTRQQKSIKAFFATAPAAKRTKQTPAVASGRQSSTTLHHPSEDYRTVLLSSSPERDMETIRKSGSLLMAIESTFESCHTRTLKNLHEEVVEDHNRRQSTSANDVRNVKKKRLGMSRPRLLRPP